MEHSFLLINFKRGDGLILNLYLINLEHKDIVVMKIKNIHQPQNGINIELHFYLGSAYTY
jgi:hypothetical protein